MGFFSAVNEERLIAFFARLIVLFTTMPIHESAHGWIAHKLGDDTAKNQGRLTLNPVRHLELFGTLLILFTGFGWAKPVPVDPRNFKKTGRKAGMALTAMAGPLANLLLAFVLMLVFQFFAASGLGGWVTVLTQVLAMMIMVNISLAVFNLLPIPPLDGYNILSFFLPQKWEAAVYRYRNYIFGAMFLLLMFTPVFDKPLGFLANLAVQGLNSLTYFVRVLSGMLFS